MEKEEYEIQYTDSESGGPESSDNDENIILKSENLILLANKNNGIKTKDLSDNESVDSEEDSSSSSAESTEDGDDKAQIHSSLDAKGYTPLGNPFGLAGSTIDSTDTSVFSVPIREERDQASSKLERHVKLTPSHRSQMRINGKKICWNYRKGKCRFGYKCVFAHDTDVVEVSPTSGELLNGNDSRKCTDEQPPDAKKMKE